MSAAPSSNIFRSEAVEYHCREQESIGIIAACMRWSWLVILISVVLLAASVAYAVSMRAEIVHVLQGRLDR